jgi:hypothetical protein
MGRLSPGQWFEVGAWLVVAGAAYGFSLQFDRDIEMYRFGAAGWPRLIILLIALGALGQFVQDLRRAQDKPLSETGYFDRFSEHGAGFFLRMGLTLALPIVYAGLLQGMGYYFLTPLFLIAYLYLTGEHRIKPLILVPLFLYLVVTFIFTRLLYVGLPTGYWPGFYDFGTWFVVLVRGT